MTTHTDDFQSPAGRLLDHRWKVARSVDGDFTAVYPDTERAEFPVCVKPQFMREDLWLRVAKLVSATPEMLDALVEAVGYIARFEDMEDGDYGPEPNEAMQVGHTLRQAIIRATGSAA